MVGRTRSERTEAPLALDTLSKFLLRNADRLRDEPAIREKDLGIWQTWTWSRVLDEVRAFAIGLTQLGVTRGDTVAIIGRNRPRLYWAQAAVQSIGAIPVPVYQDSVADEMAFVLAHAGVRFAIVEDQEQVDKLLSILDRLASLAQIIYDDDRGLKDYDHQSLRAIEAVQSAGRAAMAAEPDADCSWQRTVESGKGSDIAVMLYTSGTTGNPKGVVLTQTAIIKAAQIGIELDKLRHDDRVLAYLPLAWAGDHLLCYAQSFVAGYCVFCPERVETVFEDRREISPTYFFAPPRVFESLLTQIAVRMQDASFLKRRMYAYFMRLARRVGEHVMTGQSVAPVDRLLYGLGRILIYEPLKDRMGFRKLRIAYTAGEAIGPEIFTFYRSLGINLKQLYGQTEAGVYVTAHPDSEIYPDTVGKPVPGVEVKIAEGGEVMYRSPAQFVGYYKNDDATRSTKTDEGWVHSGDAGFFDANGHLKIIDRAKDVGRLLGGGLFAPKYIENKLKFYPNIKEAVAFGGGREFVTAMLNIELDSVANWAERHNISYSSYQELAGHPEVAEMLRGHVDEVNAALASEPGMGSAQIRRFLVLHKELDADDGEVTRTQKVRRGFISDRYAPLVDALYDRSSRGHVRTEVTFEDGRKGEIEGDIAIIDMEPKPVLIAKEAA